MNLVSPILQRLIDEEIGSSKYSGKKFKVLMLPDKLSRQCFHLEFSKTSDLFLFKFSDSSFLSKLSLFFMHFITCRFFVLVKIGTILSENLSFYNTVMKLISITLSSFFLKVQKVGSKKHDNSIYLCFLPQDQRQNAYKNIFF